MRKTFLFLSLLFVAVSTGAVAAPQHGGTDREQQACVRDVSRHCRKLINQGDFAILACLQRHRSKLSRACAKVLADHGQ